MLSSFPFHPAIVHFPIAFNILAWALDIVYALTTTYARPAILVSWLSDAQTLQDITRLSYFLLCIGLIATIPATVTGGMELMGMIKKNGGVWTKDKDGKQSSTMVPRIKAAINHAIVNDIVFVVNLANWYLRRNEALKRSSEMAGIFTNAVLDYTPTQTNVLISTVLLPLLIVAAHEGGSLVYNHGVGLNLGRKKWE